MTYRFATNVGNRNKSGGKRPIGTRRVSEEGSLIVGSTDGESSVTLRVAVREALDLSIVVSSGINELLDVRHGGVVASSAESTVSVVPVGEALKNGAVGEEGSPGENAAELVGLNERALENGLAFVNCRSRQLGEILSGAEGRNGEEECGGDLHDCGRGGGG